MTIIVNGREVHLPRRNRDITCDELTALAYGPTDEADLITITYSRGPAKKLAGTLDPGESISLRSGMVFTAVKTNKA